MNKRVAKRVKRSPLSSATIAAAALAIADSNGVDNLSFRNIAKTQGCEAMSLYHYYASKAHLLDAMVNICLSELEFPAETLSWQERLRLLGWNYRKMALNHPGFYPFLAVYRMNSMEGLGVLDGVLKVFEATGLNVEMRARQFRNFGYFLVGACLDETMGYAKGPSAAEPVPQDFAAKNFPAIMVVGRYFSRDQHARTFEVGLEATIAEIERCMRAQ
jgi:AcrR family transcriptional regulator